MPNIELAMDLNSTYALTVYLASAGVLIASLELLTLKREYAARGLFSWEVLRTASRTMLSLGSGRTGEVISHPLFVPVVAGARALAASTLVCATISNALVFTTSSNALVLAMNSHALSVACVFTIVTASIVLYWRAPLGLDGSDQMSLITFVAIGLHECFPDDLTVAHASLWFIAAQGCLSYFVAGVAKAASPVWRSGEAVRRILATRTYGTRLSASLVSGRAALCVVLAWSVILFECAFPLALVLGKAGFVAFAALGIAFHLSNALIMGLNTFVWAFVATYPAILFCARGASF